MKVEASLKVSLLGGFLGSVRGSGSYLEDKRRNTRQTRVTAKYYKHTVYEELSLGGAGPVQHMSVFNDPEATHFVVGERYQYLNTN